MKLGLSSRGLFGIGFAILVATNTVVLSGVASNRSGEPESQITLTERELPPPYQVHKENSGLALRLTWRALGRTDGYKRSSNWRAPAWLGPEKLKALGFPLNDDFDAGNGSALYKKPLPKEVFIVLENAGMHYREAVKRAEQALERVEKPFRLKPDDQTLRNQYEEAANALKLERSTKTRLFAVDAGLDAKKLRAKYGDRTRFIITKGLVKPGIQQHKDKTEVFGYISKLSVATINVPLKQRQLFDFIRTQNDSQDSDLRRPRYEVKLIYGRRLEPWILSVRSLGDNA